MRVRKTGVVLLLLVMRAVMYAAGPDSTWFPCAPARSLAAICLPDDWQKTVVTERGSLAYDYGPGPYSVPLTEISVGVLEWPAPNFRQWLPDPATPIVAMGASTENVRINIHAFALAPRTTPPQAMPSGNGRLTRLGGLNGAHGWAVPPRGTDASFADVAWGTNRPIHYLLRVPPGSSKLIALGFCESYKTRPRSRIMTVDVEGDTLRDVDPLADSVRNTPVVVWARGRDVNGDGQLAITIHPSLRSPDPNITLSTIWVFHEGAQIRPSSIIDGSAAAQAEFHWGCGTEADVFAPSVHTDALLATFDGERCTPVVRIRTRRPVIFDPDAGIVRWRGLPFLVSRPPPISGVWHGDTLLLVLPAGARRADIVVMHGNGQGADLTRVPDLRDEENRCKSYWQHDAPVPEMRVHVPDARMQYLAEASLRNIYQIREEVDGDLQYQPGPSVYRGLWLCDVMLSGNISLMMGDTASVRRALEAGFHHQGPNGQFRSLYPAVSMVETPLFLTMMFRYAQMSGNKEWLERHWGVVQKGMAWIESARLQTLDTPGTAYAGLMPPGFVDGGISRPTADYGSVWWAMIALEHGIRGAHELNREVDADCWRGLLASFAASYAGAATKDLRVDSSGHRYLPDAVADSGSAAAPQRGQYAFLLPLPYGRFFFQSDTLAETILHANLAMLDERRSEGLIHGSGWMAEGVWPWLGAIHSMAHLLVDDGPEAWTILQAVADHASPSGTWMEEQQPQRLGARTSGDGSDAEAGAFFMQALAALLVFEHQDSLVVCGGFPPAWLKPGARTSVNDLLTGCGPVSLTVETSTDGSEATLQMQAMRTHGVTGGIRIDLASFTRAGFLDNQRRNLPSHVQLPWGSTYQIAMHRR